jgi:hypothetical protein
MHGRSGRVVHIEVVQERRRVAEHGLLVVTKAREVRTGTRVRARVRVSAGVSMDIGRLRQGVNFKTAKARAATSMSTLLLIVCKLTACGHGARRGAFE